MKKYTIPDPEHFHQYAAGQAWVVREPNYAYLGNLTDIQVACDVTTRAPHGTLHFGTVALRRPHFVAGYLKEIPTHRFEWLLDLIPDRLRRPRAVTPTHVLKKPYDMPFFARTSRVTAKIWHIDTDIGESIRIVPREHPQYIDFHDASIQVDTSAHLCIHEDTSASS